MAREIEFLAAPESDDDDAAIDFAASSSHRAGSPWFWAVLAAIVVAAAATWIATRPTSSQEQAARPVHTVTAQPSSSASKPVSTTVRSCLAGPPINAQLLAIAKRNLPDLTLLPDQSFTCTLGVGLQKKVVSQSIAVRWRSLVVEIQASRRVGDGGQYLPAPQQGSLVQLGGAESQSAGLNVLVEAYGKPKGPVRNIVLSELASDVSLQLIL